MSKDTMKSMTQLLTVLLFTMAGWKCGWGQGVCDITTCENKTVVPGQSVMLSASGTDSYQWTPSTGLSATDISNPMVTPFTTTTYTVSGTCIGENLIVNGDFQQGNSVGFTSEYTKNTSLFNPGTFYVDATPSGHHSQFSGQDHTSGSGKFMMMNGATTSNTKVWQETVTVTPQTDYLLSVWVCSMSFNFDSWRAKLRFTINGTQVGADFRAPLGQNVWDHFQVNWNSGNATSATICIVDQNTGSSGNDFGLDDLFFAPILPCIQPRQVVVVVMDNIMAPPVICEGGSLTLTPPQVYGATGYTGVWQIAPNENGPYVPLDNNNIPLSYNNYCLRYAVTYQGNMYYSNVVHIKVREQPTVVIQADNTEICEGDSVVLQAEVEIQVVDDFIAVGDILCTDGTIVKPSEWPCGKNAKGIVFYVDNTDEHGWAVDLNSQVVENQPGAKWSTEQKDIPDLTNYSHWLNAVSDFNGYSNTQKIRNYGNSTKYPAAWAVDFDNGWYLPAEGQLNVLFGEIMVVNASLSLLKSLGVAATIIPITGTRTDLWSSTESSKERAMLIRMGPEAGSTNNIGLLGFERKTLTKPVRQVIDF